MPLVREPGALAPYQQIREILRREVLEKSSAGDRIAPERELAQRFGANRATISRAIASLVNEGLLVRRVGRGTFVAGGDIGLPRVKTRAVGLVMPQIEGPFPAAIIRSAVRALRVDSYKAVLYDSENSPSIEASELERLMQESLDGALVMPVELPENVPMFKQMIRLDYPLVMLDRKPIPELEADYVATDHFWGAYEATSRLIKRGHTRIAHFTIMGHRQSTSITERQRGYEQALIDHGIEIDPELICPPALYAESRFAYKHSLSYLLQGPKPITAIFAMSDIFALATIAGCRELGIRVPEDIELAAFFDGDFESVADIPLLKVVQNQHEIGQKAVDLLMRRIEGNGPEGAQTISVRPEIQDGLPKQ